MITTFKAFEAKLFNVAKIIGNRDNIVVAKEFYNDRLITEVYLKNYDKTINITWNDKEKHNIKDKIKNRSFNYRL